MVKRIILLALCFIFYITIYIDTVTATGSDEANELIVKRYYEFELLVKCYGQMFENKLIIDMDKIPNFTFQELLTHFYKICDIITETDNKGKIVPSIRNVYFGNDNLFDMFRQVFLDHFVRFGGRDKFQNKINILTNEIKYGAPSVYPLTTFVFNYKADSDKDYLTGTNEFCKKYSLDPKTFESEILIQITNRKIQFELLVKCYGQMFENKLMDINDHLNDTFLTVLTKFYTTNNINIEEVNNGDIVPSVNNKQFESDDSFDNFRNKFTTFFVRSVNEDEFRNKITILTNTINDGSNNFYYLTGPKAFCNEYSKRPKTFQNELIAQRKYEFELLVDCYGQMFNNGLIKENPKLQKNDTDTFQTVLTNFYGEWIWLRDTTNYIITEKDNNGDIVPRVNNIRFISQPLFDSFKIEFVDAFMRSGDDAEFQNQIKKLSEKIKDGVLYVHPLTTFILNYNADSDKEYLKTPSAFCYKYSKCPTFEGEILLQINNRKDQ